MTSSNADPRDPASFTSQSQQEEDFSEIIKSAKGMERLSAWQGVGIWSYKTEASWDIGITKGRGHIIIKSKVREEETN